MKRRDIEKALAANGAYFVRSGGAHDIWRCACGKHQTSIPRHGEITRLVERLVRKQMACHKEGWL
jgi:predicted RNA binding protein YcfA (HicA-like mRNA interferase family)